MDKKHFEAVETDSSVFEYDSIYDGLKAKELQQQQSKVTDSGSSRITLKEKKPKSKYVASLMQQAKLKEVEQDRVYERKLAREAKEAEEEMGKVDMKFVTSAYKKKLIEKRKWELREAMEEKKEEDARDAMLEGGGLTGFYSNLLTKNIAMGGSVEKHAKSSFTSGSKRHAVTVSYDPNAQAESVNDDSDVQKKTEEKEEEAAADLPSTKRMKAAPGDDMLEETDDERTARYRKADEERAQEEKKEVERKALEEELARNAEAEDKAQREERILAAKRRALERKQQYRVET